MAAQIAISVVADVRRAVAGIDNVGKSVQGINGRLKGFGSAVKSAFAFGAVTAFAAGAVGAIKEVGRAASDLQQSSGAVDSVFKGNAAAVKAYAKSAATDLGLSESAYLQMSATMGSSFKNAGLEDFQAKTKDTIKIGADLSAQFGGSSKEAVEALGSAFRGEFDPIERYGISIKQSNVNALLAERGQAKLTGTALKAAQATAIYDLITKQSADSTGAFAREGNTLAGAQQRQAAAVENLKAKIGTSLLPILTSLTNFVTTSVLPAVERFANYLQANLPGAIAAVKPVLSALGTIFTTVIVPAVSTFAKVLAATVIPALVASAKFFNEHKTIIGIVAGVITAVMLPALAAYAIQSTIAWATSTAAAVKGGALAVIELTKLAGSYAKTAAAAVVSAGRYVVLTTALAAQRVAIIATTVATNVWAVAQKALNLVMRANPIGIVITVIAALVAGIIYAYKHSETFRKIVDAAWKGIKTVSLAVFNFLKDFIPGVFKAVVSLVTGYVNLQLSIIKGVWNAIKSLTQAAWTAIKNYIINPVRQLPGLVRQYFEQMRQAVVDRVNAIIARVKEMGSQIVNAIKNFGTLLVSAGRNLMQGFLNGIKQKAQAVIDYVAGLGDRISGKIKSILGIKSPSRVFRDIGMNLGKGLEVGIKRSERGVLRTVGSLANHVESGFSPALAFGESAPAASGGRTTYFSPTVNIYAHPLSSPAEIGREVDKSLTAFYRQNGTR